MKIAEEVLSQKVSCLIRLQPELERPHMGMLHGLENMSNLRKPPLVLPEIEGVTALEVDLNQHETFIVFAKNGFEEPSAPENFDQHEIVRGREVVEVILRR